jgi:hypothetical protein
VKEHENNRLDACLIFLNVITNALWCYSFLTIPNAFKQCPISLLIIYSAISKDLKKNFLTAELSCCWKISLKPCHTGYILVFNEVPK